MRTIWLTVFFFAAGVAAAAPKIVGHWKSNQELTLQTVTLPDYITEDLRERFENLFGKLELTYTGSECIAYTPASGDHEATTERLEYRVIMETKSKLVIRSINPETGEPQNYEINFVSPNRYWVAFPESKLPYMQNAREYFDRIPESSERP